MPWVEFSRDFDWSPPSLRGRVTIAYRAGMRLLVTTPCALAAEAAGKGAVIPKPKDKRDAGGKTA